MKKEPARTGKLKQIPKPGANRKTAALKTTCAAVN
jgi:hypothetical protein